MTDTTPEMARKIATELDDFNASLDAKSRVALRSLAAQVERLTADRDLHYQTVQSQLAAHAERFTENQRLTAELAEAQKNYATMLILEAELRAKLAALEKQEPVAVMKQHHLEDFPAGTAPWAYFPKGRPPAGSKLYLSAGAKE